MNSIQFDQPMGYAGVAARMTQLEQMLGMDQANTAATTGIPSNLQSTDFGSTLQGAIGNTPFDPNNLNPASQNLEAPMSPFAPNMGILNPSGASGSISELKSLATSAANAVGLDPALFDSLITQESDYQPNSRSRAGAMGLAQLTSETAKSLGVTNPYDPVQNLNGGARYLKDLISQFGSVPLGLAAYNAGPNAVRKFGTIPPYTETQDYVRKILNNYEQAKTRG